MTKNKNNGNGLQEQRDPHGRFISGNIGGGRKIGSRNQLTTAFVDDVLVEWRRSGPSVLKRLAADDPGAFARLVAQILPKELDQTLNVNVSLFERARTFGEAYRFALEHIGADADDELIEGEANSKD